MTGLPPVLDTGAVMERYGLRDRRAARKVMDEAGAFHVAGRLVVREDDLDEWERAAMQARRAPEAQDGPPAPRRPTTTNTATRVPLAPGWWREPTTEEER